MNSVPHVSRFNEEALAGLERKLRTFGCARPDILNELGGWSILYELGGSYSTELGGRSVFLELGGPSPRNLAFCFYKLWSLYSCPCWPVYELTVVRSCQTLVVNLFTDLDGLYPVKMTWYLGILQTLVVCFHEHHASVSNPLSSTSDGGFFLFLYYGSSRDPDSNQPSPLDFSMPLNILSDTLLQELLSSCFFEKFWLSCLSQPSAFSVTPLY